MSAAMTEGAATLPLTVHQMGKISAALARAEIDAQDRDTSDRTWWAAYEGVAAATLSLPATSMEEVMILAALVRGAVSNLGNHLQVALMNAPPGEAEAAQELEDRVRGALTVIVQALSDLTGTPIEVAAADFDWSFQLDERKLADGAA